MVRRPPPTPSEDKKLFSHYIEMPYKNREQQLSYLKTWRLKQKEKKPIKKPIDTSMEGGKIKPNIQEKPFEEALARAEKEAEDKETEDKEAEDETDDEETDDEETVKQEPIDVDLMYRQADAFRDIPTKYFHTPHGIIIKLIEEIMPHIDGWSLEKVVKLANDTFSDKYMFVKRCYFLHLLNGLDTRKVRPLFGKHFR